VCLPSDVVNKCATPMSIPTALPVCGNGAAGTSIAGEDDVPACALALDRYRRDPALDRAVLVHPDVPHTLEPDTRHPVVGRRVPPTAVPVFAGTRPCPTCPTPVNRG
jgi:hypothetical protein